MIKVEEIEDIPYREWQKAEMLVKSKMENEFGLKFSKKKLIVGYKLNGLPKYKEFDLVSEDGKIVVQVKSSKPQKRGKKPSTNITRCYGDCYLLEKVVAWKKILALTNREFYDIFKKDSEGLLSDVEVRLIE
jgi:hypothetical protein